MDPEQLAGTAAALVALALAAVVGLVRRRRDGRFRVVGPAATTGDGGGATVADPGDAGADTGRADNSGHAAAGAAAGTGAEPPPASERLTPEDIGSGLGERATLVQFSTAFCQPCRATRRVLTEVGGMVDGVAHVEIDAESHLDLVRRLDVRRTPTVLVLDGRGHVTRRASGQPRKADVIAALGEAID